ncbi:hypothetical protein D9M69_432960 [compost metagenome]
MVGRAAHEAVVQRGPGFQHLAALDQFVVAGGQLPDAADVPAAALRLEGHLVDVLGPRLEVIQIGVAADRVAEGGMRRDVGDALAIEVHFAPIAQHGDVLGAGLDHVVLLC